ncbi:hypothetical protein AJ78_02453 [Emergomyces pasteurianus Ep9510]|uniref:Telomere-associated protein Rif1 N-terminal domain-containing protein n=1 Tax=Emergomyces pasteurianus Ep9510 TaxID=1447872 RepID=A0A1J9PLU2_9EURO|nr:hypothetical protein AJ78_02453 [Emergomyces pasteurianus Ep9510]
MVDVLSFNALSARPPTPPRSSSFNSAASQSDNQQPPSRRAPVPTPDDGSSPLNLSPFPQSTGSSKRVNFSPLTSYIKPPPFTSSNNPKSRAPLRTLPPSNQCRPSKSILKASYSSPASPLSDEQPYNASDNLPAMLESISKQLAGDSRTSRADAYQQLLGALAAYKNIPDEGALVEIVEKFSQYIRRDICEVSGTYQPLDIKLVRQALNLFAMFIYKPKLSSRLSDDLKSSIIDHSISSLQNHSVPKSVTIEYMRVLSIQRFTPKIMTSNRVTLLLAVLKDITDRVEGKAVVAQRLAIYESLLLLAKPTMASQADLWMDHLITALLHNFKEVRTRAIRFGKLAGLMMCPHATVSSALREVLDVTLENGSPFVLELCGRLAGMIQNPDSGTHVPQIWSIVILLLRSKRWPMDHWPHLKDWLLVIQKCFNCSDLTIKSQALMAWDLFVYSSPPTDTTSIDISKILFRPILSQLERKKSDKQGVLFNRAFTSYHKLLYYAFRPSASHRCLTYYWAVYIATPFSGNLNSDPANNDRLCRILSSLLWNQQPKIWDEDKITINDVTTPGPDDLPRLDCKWIRSRLSIILPVFKSLFMTSAWSDDDLDKSCIGLAWTNLSKALGDASSKEITPSPESMRAIGVILGTLQRTWRTAPLSLNVNGDERNDTFYKRFQFLLTTVISYIGPGPFTDKLLSQISQDNFQTATTPTHHRRPVDNNVRSPILHLLHLITLSPPPLSPSASLSSSKTGLAYFQLLNGIIEMGVQGKASRNAKLETLRQFAELCLEQSANVPDVSLECLASCHYVWQNIAKLTMECLAASPIETEIKNRDDSASNDYENITTILVAGSGFEPVLTEWSKLLDSFSSVVRVEKGETALASVIEALSGAIRSQPLTTTAGCCAALLELAKFPAIQDQLPPPLHPPVNKPPFGHCQIHPYSYSNLIALASRVLKEIYVKITDIDYGCIARFLDSTTKFMDRCPPSFGLAFLGETQISLTYWLTDRDGLLTSRPDVNDSIIVSARALTRSTTKLLQKLAESEDALLRKLSTLITSGLESRHKSTVNHFIKLWNNSFGLEETLAYPDNVETALRRLKPFVHLLLPNFPPTGNSTPDLASLEFLSSQEELTRSETPNKLIDRPSKIYKASSASPAQTTTPVSAAKTRRRKRSTPSTTKVTTPKPRFRHDDSQLQFVPVDFSPALDTAADTQVLTNHQKEIRDRQRVETAKLYPGLRSSTSQLDQDTGVQMPIAKLGDFNNEQSAPPTPTLHLAISTNDEEFVGSSPTPTSKTSVAQPDQMIGSSLSSALDIAGLHSEDPPSSPPQIQTHESRNIEASETKRICEIKDQDIIMNGDLSSPPRSSPTPVSGDSNRRRGVLSSRKNPERKVTRPNNGSNPGTAETSQNPHFSSDFPADHADPATPGRIDVERQPKPSRRDNRVSNAQSDRIDIIPDSFSDDLERQIASQLEQDLELSMDMEVPSRVTQMEQDPSVVTRSMKRKRDDRLSSQRDGAKRVSPDSASPAAVDGVIASKYIASHRENTPTRTDVSPSTRPSRSSRRRGNSMLDSEQAINFSSSTRKSLHSPSQRKSKKRRSLRLSGQSAPPEPLAEHTDQQGARKMCPNSTMIESPTADIQMNDQADPANSEAADLTSTADQDGRSGNAESSGAGILTSLRSVLGSLRSVTFGRPVLREIEDVMFDIKVEAHGAARRHDAPP